MVGVRIKNLRKAIGLTQAELGNKLGVIKQTVSSWENEISSPGNDALIKMADIFNVSLDYLLGKTNNDDALEQSELEYTTEREREFLSIYRKYVDNGYSDEILADIIRFMPEIENANLYKCRTEEKLLHTFRNLNEDNQDIIIGKSKELLREQDLQKPPVAAEGLRKASGK